MNPRIILQRENLRVDFLSGGIGKRLCVTFSHFGNRVLDGGGFGGEFLTKNDFDVIAFKNILDNWYQNLSESDVDIVNAFLDTLPPHEFRTSYGSSMGGYAAIMFAKQFKIDRVLAFGPQFAIDEPWDKRWAKEAAKIGDFRYRFSDDVIVPGCEYFLIYDRASDDRPQAAAFEVMFSRHRATIAHVPHGGHQVSNFLRDIGALKGFSLTILERGVVDDIRENRRMKASSVPYLRELALRAARQSKPRIALRIIERALALNQKDGWNLAIRSYLCERLGQLNEALQAAQQADAAHSTTQTRLRINRLTARLASNRDNIGI